MYKHDWRAWPVLLLAVVALIGIGLYEGIRFLCWPVSWLIERGAKERSV